jgi:hypothetical protein
VLTGEGAARNDDIHRVFEEPEADLCVSADIVPVSEEEELSVILSGTAVQDVVLIGDSLDVLVP